MLNLKKIRHKMSSKPETMKTPNPLIVDKEKGEKNLSKRHRKYFNKIIQENIHNMKDAYQG